MSFRISAVILAVILCSPVIAGIVTVVESVETMASNINVPPAPNGRLMFKPCAEKCDEEFISVRLTPATRYFVRGQTVEFIEFRREFFNLRRGSDDYALVSYHTKDRTVASIRIGD